MTTDYLLIHPRLSFWVDVTIHERDGRFMATADLAEDSRDVGVGDTAQEAVSGALQALGEPYASVMVASMRLKMRAVRVRRPIARGRKADEAPTRSRCCVPLDHPSATTVTWCTV